MARIAALFFIVAAFAGHAQCDTGRADEKGFARLSELVNDPAFEEVFDRSFEIILSDSQRLEYAALSPRHRSLYRRRFWLKNDPTPATDDNEFLNEFARRIDYALSNFCAGDNLEWDDRGDVAVRFGLPASRGCTIGDFGLTGAIVYPIEVWYYPRMDMSLEFVWKLDGGGYVLGSNAPASSGGILASPEMAIAPVTEPTPIGVEIPEIAHEVMAVEGEHAAYKAEQIAAKESEAVENVPVSYGYRPAVEPLMVFYEVVTARGEDGLTDVAVNYQVPVSGLSLDDDADRAVGSIIKRIRILDQDLNVVASDVRRLGVSCEPASERDARGPVGRLITDEWRLDAAPGEYTIEIAVEDTASGRTGYGRSRTFIRGYRGRRLSMSDIQIATAVGGGGRFVRMDGAVIPNPCRAFWRDEKLTVYFEVYNLSEDRPGESRFTVTTQVAARERKSERHWLASLFSGKEREHAVSSRIVAVGSVPETAYWFSLDLGNLPQDNYDLTVTVKDVRSKQEITESATFTVVERP